MTARDLANREATPMAQYEPHLVVQKYEEADELGRLQSSLDTEVMYQIERLYIERFMPKHPNAAAIDVGGGPGRYAVEMARLGIPVLLVDITPKHIQQAIALAQSAGVTDRFLGFEVLDALDIGRLGGGRFDLAVCYGMLNYLLDRDIDLLNGIREILVPGGCFLLSVMGLYGAIRSVWAAGSVTDAAYRARESSVLQTGVNAFGKPARKFYTAEEIRALVLQAGFSVLEMAAAPTIAGALCGDTKVIMADAGAMDHILAVERRCCALPGLLDLGQHIIVVGKKPHDT